jgi:uncharacterized coiled-coil protein SlyX
MEMEDAMIAKVDSHESRITQLEIRTSINENNIDNLNKKLDKIDATLTKLSWLVMAAVLGAVLKSIGLI